MKLPRSRIKLKRTGAFVTKKVCGSTSKKKIGKPIRVRAIGVREHDNVVFVEIRFKTECGRYLNQLFRNSALLPTHRKAIQERLADLGYEWPQDRPISKALLDTLCGTRRPSRRFVLVRAPGWYSDDVLVFPDEAFTRSGSKIDVRIDPETDAHIGAFLVGKGSLKGWQRYREPRSQIVGHARVHRRGVRSDVPQAVEYGFLRDQLV